MTINEFNLACLPLETVLIQLDPAIDAFDCAYIHGYLTAITISPATVDTQAICKALSEESITLNIQQQADLEKAIAKEIRAIDRLLNTEDESLDITFLNHETLATWCTGFLAVHFQQVDVWFKKQQEVSELLLPIMLLSSLFDDELEFREMARNEYLLDDMQEQLPEVLTELYLLFRE